MSKFFVVKDPTTMGHELSLGDMLMEFTTSDHAKYVIGTGLARYDQENHSVHFTRKDAEADILSRIERMGVGLDKLLTEMHGSPPKNRVDMLRHLFAAVPTVQLWAGMRGKVSLADIIEMVRQDIEASGTADQLELACENLRDGVVKANIA